jgi:hypothetical protein
MTSVDVDEIADRLYALPPDEFTAARDQEAKQAESAYLRKAVTALRKPTVAAHAVNQLVRDRTEDVDALISLGEALRTAMGDDPAEVRRLTEERRTMIAGLLDRDLSPAVREEVSATLEAATADPDMAASVRSGRLVKPLHYAGFGSLDFGSSMPTAKKEKQAPAEPSPDLTAARDRVLELSGIADDAQRRYEAAVKTATEARQVLEAAEAERAEAHKEAKAAHAEAEKARRDLARLDRTYHLSRCRSRRR